MIHLAVPVEFVLAAFFVGAILIGPTSFAVLVPATVGMWATAIGALCGAWDEKANERIAVR